MSTVTKTVKLGDFTVGRNDRTDMRSQIQKYWVGREYSPFGIQYVQYTHRPEGPGMEKYRRETKGKIVVPAHSWERDDIFCIQHWEPGVNTFVDLSGDSYKISIQPWNGVSLSPEDEQTIREQVAQVMKDPANADYIERQRRWFNEKPWKQLNGLTPEEAVSKLESMGW